MGPGHCVNTLNELGSQPVYHLPVSNKHPTELDSVEARQKHLTAVRVTESRTKLVGGHWQDEGGRVLTLPWLAPFSQEGGLPDHKVLLS